MKPAGKTRRPGKPTGARRHTRNPHLAVLTRTNHDLRSPLSVILGVLELLEETASLRETERRYVKLASDAAAELVSQADAIRLYSAMARHLVALDPTGLDFATLARERLHPALERRHVMLAETAGDGSHVLADPGYLTIALTTLGRHLAAHLQESGSDEPLQLVLKVTQGDKGMVLLSLQRLSGPEPAPAEVPEPGAVDLAVVNAVRLVELMGGSVRMNPEQPYLFVELPAAGTT